MPIEDTVMIEYSTNWGVSWMPITNTATKFKYKWHIPKTPSNKCLVRIKYNFIDTNQIDDDTEVRIGNQIWMKKNLDIDHYRNGDPIPCVQDDDEWKNLTNGAWCHYLNKQIFGTTYGKLYNWYTVSDPRGIAPEGWRIPSDADWTDLEIYLGGVFSGGGGKLKEAGTAHWSSPNDGATNESGFTALPGGYRSYYSPFYYIYEDGYWWTCTEYDEKTSWYRNLYYSGDGITRGYAENKGAGYSIRCIKEPQDIQMDTSGLFIISPQTIQNIRFINLRNNEKLNPNDIYEIQWEGVSFSEKVKIEYSTNGGTDWIEITDTASGLSYNWKVPNTVSTNCLARISVYEKDCAENWMKINLDVDHYRNGDPIPEVKDANEWENLTTGAWCYFSNLKSNGTHYGKLYNWYAVNDQRGLAPEGWRIPTDAEWTELELCLGNEPWDDPGGKMKETGNAHWRAPNKGATNETGFTALPGGKRSYYGQFYDIYDDGYWWSSNLIDSTFLWYRNMWYNFTSIGRGSADMREGYSVRCIKDVSISNLVDTSGKFSIVAQNNLRLFNLSNNETLCPNTEYEILWDGVDSNTVCKLEYSTNLGTNWINITDSATGLKYNWTVPNTPSTNCTVRISAQVIDTSLEVKIGNQIWMKRNLDVDHYRTGDSIPEIRNNSEWTNLTTGAWCYYNNEPSNGAIYGKLYNWHAVNNSMGLAPTGWHIPSDIEWTELENYLGGWEQAGGKLKETGITHWKSPNIGATNEFGFSALPCGYRYFVDGSFGAVGLTCAWWTSTEYEMNDSKSYYRNLTNTEANFYWDTFTKSEGLSVRCVKDSLNLQMDSSGIFSISSLPSPIITGKTDLCLGDTTTYKSNIETGLSHSWSVQEGEIIGTNDLDSVKIFWNLAGSGIVKLVQTNSADCVDSTEKNITISDCSKPVITGDTSLCEGETIIYNCIKDVSISYLWSVVGGKILGFKNFDSLKVNWDTPGTGKVKVIQTKDGRKDSTELNVTVNPLPSPIITSGSEQVVEQSICDYESNLDNGVSYNWFVEKGKIKSGATNQIVTVEWDSSGVVSIGKVKLLQTISSTGCQDSTEIIITIRPYQIQAYATLKIDSSFTAKPREQIEIPVYLYDSKNLDSVNINTIDAELHFNSTLLVPIIESVEHNQNDNWINLTWKKDRIQNNIFKPVSKFYVTLGNDTSTQLSLKNIKTYPNIIDVSSINGRFTLAGVCMEGGVPRLLNTSGQVNLQLLRPNPTESKLTIDYEVIERGHTEIYLVNSFGERIKTILSQEVRKGIYSVDADLNDIGSGLYFIILQTPTVRKAEKIEVLK